MRVMAYLSTFGQIATVASVVALSTPALAQQKMEWHSVDTDYGAALIFGVPETDEAMIFFTCEKGKDAIEVRPLTGTKGLKADDPARAVLSAGSVKKTFSGKAISNEENGQVNVLANGTMADLKALVKGGKKLAIETKGKKASVTLSGAPEAAAKFEATCAKAG